MIQRTTAEGKGGLYKQWESNSEKSDISNLGGPS